MVPFLKRFDRRDEDPARLPDWLIIAQSNKKGFPLCRKAFKIS